MKDICYVIKDLLPLYHEKMLSPQTMAFVEKHLPDCPDCQLDLLEMDQPVAEKASAQDASLVPLQKIKKQLFHKKVLAILTGILTALTIATLAFSYLTARKFIPYDKNVITTQTLPNGELAFKVTKLYNEFQVEYATDEQGNRLNVAYVSFYTTPLEESRKIRVTGDATASIPAKLNGQATSVYYLADGQEPVHLAGPVANGHTVTLPRLALSYYFWIATGLTIIFAILAWFSRNNKLGKITKHLTIFGLAYLVAQLLTKGINFSSFTLQRDLSLILLVALFLTLITETVLSLLKQRQK